MKKSNKVDLKLVCRVSDIERWQAEADKIGVPLTAWIRDACQKMCISDQFFSAKNGPREKSSISLDI